VQTTAVPGWHVPPPQTSAPLQRSASAQEAVLFAVTQPDTGLHELSVHTLVSVQSSGVPAPQTPVALQVSAPLQTVASAHDAPDASN
jgi:hypothetical protein